MALATLTRPSPETTYRGIPVLDLHVGDPIPQPRAPERYAVRVTPDLARYLLTFNTKGNRSFKEISIAKFARDMHANMFPITPHSIIFSSVLEDGQNRLMAVTVYGEPVWLMLDFGWPEGTVNFTDKGSAKTPGDTFKVNGIPQANVAAAAVATVALYDATVGSSLSWQARNKPTTAEALRAYQADDLRWQQAVQVGSRVGKALSMSDSQWIAAHYLIDRNGGDAGGFFAELLAETGDPGSPTRRLAKIYLRWTSAYSKTKDSREPLENIIRAYNAWRRGGSFSPVSKTGFDLSRIR